MEYICREFFDPQEDEPRLIYSELDEARREVRRVEFYPGGFCFACGGDRGQAGALRREPFPPELRQLTRPGVSEARSVSGRVFSEIWLQAQAQPESFMQLFY